jgi:hypothetical protein
MLGEWAFRVADLGPRKHRRIAWIAIGIVFAAAIAHFVIDYVIGHHGATDEYPQGSAIHRIDKRPRSLEDVVSEFSSRPETAKAVEPSEIAGATTRPPPGPADITMISTSTLARSEVLSLVVA